MTKQSLLQLTLTALALPLCAIGCDAEPVDADADTEFETPRAGGIWQPKPIKPQWCENPEFEPSRPPDPGGCDIELRLIETQFVTGQGISEGRGELSTDVTSTSNGGSVGSASVSERTYTVGERKNHELMIDTYHLAIGAVEQVQVCADFTEHDGGGGNGQDDVGTACTQINLECDPGNGVPTQTVTLGPVALCGPNQCNGSAAAKVEIMREDADGDNVPNADDFTPEPCDEHDKASEGVALLLYFHYDDDAFTTLAQSMGTNLSKHYGAYDYVALVMDNATSNANGTSNKAFSHADVVFEPTRDGLMDAMQHLTAKGYRFDTFVHAHGYKRGSVPSDSKFEVLSGGMISGDWLVDATHPDNIGTARGGIPIIAWWATTCYAARMIDAWETIGAIVASAAIDVQFYPNAWLNFWDGWVAGDQYRPAVDDSVTPSVVTASDSMIVAQGEVGPYWCVAPTAIGQNPCAEDFFNDDVGANEAMYNLDGIYDHGMSGKDNMAAASVRDFIGIQTVTFGAAFGWP
ncbi:hypothetical protein [Enhygromyxa salina]|uniref:Uncharacterized protein n=1 Tax=Enhygromyxa salina TaxID=215803 RepID=A0A2S9YSQ4_9BACT|nr:hypothetical protein [Enhygromyxa salina]PRQ08141.1 hypothetical protein ENSA7_21130 [Enhygromyxa salina]